MTTPAKVKCDRVGPSVASELAWLLNLVVQNAAYAEPALAELERSLLPGVTTLRPTLARRFASLWKDRLAGCPELLLVAGAGGCLADADVRRLLTWLSTLPRQSRARHELLTEPLRDRRLVRGRLAALESDIALRRAYRDVLAELWQFAEPRWERRGRGVATRASADWRRRLAGVTSAPSVIGLLPPRHPLTIRPRPSAVGLLRRRRTFTIAPIYFCMSGGQAADLGEQLHIGVPASGLEPIRKSRDAAFVAQRTRIFSEPTRMHVLIHIMSAPSGVMDITRALRLSQPTVSEHVRLLVAADLVRRERRNNRTVYVASPRRVERLLADAGATLVRWSGENYSADELLISGVGDRSKIDSGSSSPLTRKRSRKRDF